MGIRLPEADKDRLREVARKQKRDVSNLALALICRGLDAMERDTNPNGVTSYATAGI